MASARDALYEAASNGDYELLKTLLLPDPTQSFQEADVTIEQLLAKAARKGHAQTVAYCVRLGARVNDSDIHDAVVEGNSLEVYKVLVPAGYNLNFRHDFVGGPLCWLGDDTALAAYLLSHGADPNRDMQTGRYQPISVAARNPSDISEIVELFIKHGAQIDGSGAIILAAMHGNLKVVECLISHGANVNLDPWTDTMIFARREEAESALHKAVRSGNEAIVGLLIDNDADRSCLNANGRTARDLAQELGMTGIVSIL